jgi:hypothetical protein
MVPLKDETLSRLAAEANVAQFVSFGPGADLPQRHSRLRGHRPDHRFATAADAVAALLALAPGGSVNVRSFRAGAPRGGPFSYGLTRGGDVLAVLRARAADGLHTIANETVDVDDGGVSGVAMGGLVEFAPGDTPRSVERPGTVALGHADAVALLRTVYGFPPDLDGHLDQRVEFSLHPLAAGVRQTHTILWEAEPVAPVRLAKRLTWPNRYSRHLGDKAFGLLAEDPSGTAVVAVLAQEGVPARWSGAALPAAAGGLLVEGVPGFGDDFMLARAAPTPLPDQVLADVRRVGGRAAAALGPVRLEWAHDGRDAWVLQLQLATVASSGTTIHPGIPSRWHRFDPTLGLERLRDLIAAVAPGEGIELTGDVGVTSHAGDLLRRSAIPSRLAR